MNRQQGLEKELEDRLMRTIEAFISENHMTYAQVLGLLDLCKENVLKMRHDPGETDELPPVSDSELPPIG